MSETINPVGSTLIQTDDGPSERADDQQASEFDRMEDLTAKLVQVPKSEVDEKLKKA